MYLEGDEEAKERTMKLLKAMNDSLSRVVTNNDRDIVNDAGKGSCYEHWFKRGTVMQKKLTQICSTAHCKDCAYECAKFYNYSDKKSNLGAWE